MAKGATTGRRAARPAPVATAAPPVEQANLPDADTAAPLDQLLVDAAVGPVRRWWPGRAGLEFIAGLARRPDQVGLRVAGLATELGRIAAGWSKVGPPRGDRRFTDPAWAGNPLLHRLVQAYLAVAETATTLVDDAGLQWRSDQRMHFLAENLVEAAAPSNLPFVNPAAVKAALDTGGASVVRGVTNFARDMSSPPRVPSMVDPDTLKPGRDLALSPGSVVFRSPILELIQYAPQTERVRTVPLLIVPPTINKFYVTDLAPGRSLTEYLVQSGQQVFTISWRNPKADAAPWGMDAYGRAILDALDAVEQITGSERTLVQAACSGGIITSMLLGHLAATASQDRIAGLSLLVTVLDQAKAGLPAALVDQTVLDRAAASSARRGYLDGAALAEIFAWLRPGDLIWNYWVNNYLLGRQPPTFDILSWNADTTRMTAGLHRDFLTVGGGNLLVTPGAAKMLGTPVDLSAVHVDAYLVAGIADHLCPWQNCYRSTQLLGGKSRFVLSTSGHVAAIVNPPGNPKANYQVNTDNPADPERWLDTATRHQGTWWDDYVGWLSERGGAERPAATELGGPGLPPLATAPGTYLFES